jgi:photosystem II stability/assembly factor-like uncharacterized protein
MALSMSVLAQWAEQATGFATASRGIRWISAVDPQIAWAAAYDGSGGAAACQDIAVTTNGGNLWTPKIVAGVTNLDIANIAAVSDQKAWAAMFPPASTTTGQGIYITTNGGNTWTRQTTATFSNASSFVNVVHFFDPILGFCMGDPISGEFEIYTTDDGGTTWTAVPGSQIPNPVSGEFGVIGYYSAVGDIVWFGTNKGRVYKSIDNGHNWTVSAITGWGAKYVQPFFRDEMNGICMDKSQSSTGAMVRTTDGGATWTPITTTGQVFTNDMAFIPGSDPGAIAWVTTGAATGMTGVTYSFNDGVAWNDMAATLGTQFLATTWLNDSTGWAGGFNTDATTGGMFKFTSSLRQPDFSANQTNVAMGGTVKYSISQGAHSTSSVKWTFPGGTPATSTQRSPSVVYNTSGTYNVKLEVTNTWGIAIKEYTSMIYVGGVGVGEKEAVSVNVYPNPVKGMLNIESSRIMNGISLINLTGQVVYNMKSESNSAQINTSDFTAGLYNLQITVGEKIINKKIVVK